MPPGEIKTFSTFSASSASLNSDVPKLLTDRHWFCYTNGIGKFNFTAITDTSSNEILSNVTSRIVAVRSTLWGPYRRRIHHHEQPHHHKYHDEFTSCKTRVGLGATQDETSCWIDVNHGIVSKFFRNLFFN